MSNKPVDKKTTFSIEIYAGVGVHANAYGIHPSDVRKEVQTCLDQMPLYLLFEPEGFDIQIRREDL